MALDRTPLYLFALLAAWLLRAVSGRNRLADAVERPAHAWGREGGPVALAAALGWGTVLGLLAAGIRFVADLLLSQASLRATFWSLFTLDALILLGVTRVPPRREASPAVLARQTLTPLALYALAGPWLAYAYRAAAAYLEASGGPPVLQRLLDHCDWLPRNAAALAYVVARPTAAADGENPPCAEEATPSPAGVFNPHSAFRIPQSARARRRDVIFVVLLALAAGIALAGPLLSSPDFYWCSERLSYPHRVWALVTELRRGVLYPRWYPEFAWGFGYPFPNFYAPLSYYLAAGLHGAGLSYPVAVKGVAALVFAGAAAAMFLLARPRLGPAPAAVAAASFAGSGYLLHDVYPRGDLAEALCFVWLPLALGQVAHETGACSPRHAAWCAVPVAALALTHNITAMLAMPLLLALAFFPWHRGPRSPAACAGLLMGLGLAAFFWLPALLEKRFVRIHDVVAGGYRYSVNFLSGRDYLSLNGEPFSALQGGTALCFLALLALLVLARGGAAARQAGRFERWMVLLLAVALLMTSRASRLLWDTVPLLVFAQFPWRFGVFVSLAMAYLAGLGIRLLREIEPEEAPALKRRLLVSVAATLVPSVLILVEPPSFPTQDPAALSLARLFGALLLAGAALAAQGRRRGALLPAVAVLLSLGLGAWEARVRYQPLAAPASAFTPEGYRALEEEWQIVGTTARAEYLPRWAPRRRPPGVPGELRLEAGRVLDGGSGPGYRRAWRVETPAPVPATYGAFYFPGWEARVDGAPIPVASSADGLVSFHLPAGQHRVAVDFVDTPVRRAAWVASGLASLLLILCLFWKPAGARGTPVRGEP